MSNVHLGLPFVGETVDHSSHLSRDVGVLYLNSDFSDVTLNVNGQRFHAHKVILAARSYYFRALLYGGLKESHQAEIEIKSTSQVAFKILLKYIYTGQVNLSSEKEDVVLDILGLAHQYGFGDLETAICEYLKNTLCTDNICIIYDMAALYSLSNLSSVCEDFMDKNAQAILSHESFVSLSANALKSIIGRDSFCALEVQIFRGVQDWQRNNADVPANEMQEIISKIRLPLMSCPDLLKVVRPSSLISSDSILDAIETKNESKDTDLQYRGFLLPGENVATTDKEAAVIHGEMRTNLLDGNVIHYDMDRGFTRHPIDDNNGQGILIKLGRPYIINYMQMLLWDKDHRAYSYYIEVSMDQHDWVRVIDHTKYHCRSWQFLHFHDRVVRYIRIVGTHNTINRVFHVISFEAKFTKQDVNLHKGLIVPKENVALVSKSAKVIEGVSRARNNLLNGDIHQYDWDSGYTCHQLGSGSISLQLGQPYWLSTCRMLLWDCDDRSYSYYIEGSTNGKDWRLLVGKNREPCKSWQNLQFNPQAIVYFRIVGTFNTANEVFHCVHFESPTQPGHDKKEAQINTTHPLPTLPEVAQQPRGLAVGEVPLRPHKEGESEDEDGEGEGGRWMGAGEGPPVEDMAVPDDHPFLHEFH